MISFDNKKKSKIESPLESAENYQIASNAIVQYFIQSSAAREKIRPEVHFDLDAAALSKLRELSNSCCAFCEQRFTGPDNQLSAYRYRPPRGAVDPQAAETVNRDAYFWLALSWKNLFPICPDCKPRNTEIFPILKDDKSFGGKRAANPDNLANGDLDPEINQIKEWPALIYPGEFPLPHDVFDLEISSGHARLCASPKATKRLRLRVKTTVDHYFLNREALTEQRAMVIDRFLVKLGNATPELWETNQPFAGILALVSGKILEHAAPDMMTNLKFTDMTGYLEGVKLLLRHWIEQTSPDRRQEVIADIVFSERKDTTEPDAPAPETSGPTQNAARDNATIRVGHVYYIHEISLHNFRPFTNSANDEDPITIPIGRGVTRDIIEGVRGKQKSGSALMFLGENGSGKTSLLQAIALSLLGRTAIGEFNKEFHEPLISDSTCLPKSNKSAANTFDKAEVVVKAFGIRNPTDPAEGKTISDLQFKVEIDRDAMAANNGKGHENQRHEGGSSSSTYSSNSNPANLQVAYFPPVLAYGPNRVFNLDPSVSGDGILGTMHWHSHIMSLFRRDHPLPNPTTALAELKNHSNASAKEAYLNLCEILTKVLEFNGRVDGFEVEECDDGAKRVCVKIRPPLAEGTETPEKEPSMSLPLEVLSSGYLSLISIICNLFITLFNNSTASSDFDEVAKAEQDSNSANRPRLAKAHEAHAIVLIDEIEAHLHPRWKLSVISKLRECFPNVFFIFTTHDPLCLRGMRDGEVYTVERIFEWTGTDGSSRIEISPFMGSLDRLTTDQLLTSDLFGLFGTDSPETNLEILQIIQNKTPGSDDDALTEHLRKDVTTALPFLNGTLVQELASCIREALLDDTDPQDNTEAVQSLRDRLIETINAQNGGYNARR